MLSINRKIIIGIIISLFVLVSIGFTTEGSRSNILSYGTGVKVLGMGEASTALTDNDLSVISYNPSLLAMLDKSQIMASYWSLYDSAKYSFLGFAYTGKNSAFAITGQQFCRDNIEARETLSSSASLAKNAQTVFQAGYGGLFKKLKLRYGVAFRYLYYDIYKYQDSGGGVDIGFSKKLMDKGSLDKKKIVIETGLMVKNVYQLPIKLIEDEELLPMTIRFGLVKSITLFPRYKKKKNVLNYDKITLSGDIEYVDSEFDYFGGLEYKYSETLALRGGWKDGITAGMGISLNDISFDYAFTVKEFTNFHRVGFVYKFGMDKRTENNALTEDFQRIYKKADRTYNRCYREASAKIEKNDFKGALKILEKILPLKVDSRDIKQAIKICEKGIITNKLKKIKENYEKYKKDNKIKLAYQECLKGIMLNNVKTFQQCINNLSENINLDQMRELEKLKQVAIDKLIERINTKIQENDFEEAWGNFNKLVFLGDKEQIKRIKKFIKTKENIYVTSLIKDGVEKLKQKERKEAYHLFAKASKIRPKDKSVLGKKDKIRNIFLKERNFTIQENLYADKLYCLVALDIADENVNAKSSYKELESFHPYYNNIELLGERIK